MKTDNNRTFVPGESVASGNSRSDTVHPAAPQTASDGRQLHGSPPAADLDAPAELANHPDYELVKELGRGGMGVVYLARNRMMDRLEVLKVVSKSLLDRPGALERFQQEIRSAARLNHPNIVAAHSVLRPGDLLVFAMEYVDGQDLAEVVARRGALPVANAAFYAHQAALGLQHAHEKSMVHRDIKPNNLMLSQEAKRHVVKILDFGLAKATSEKSADSGLTKTGQMLGTPDYIAPEQTLDAQKADIRADIYSLGCTFYFLLAGRPPFEGSSLYQILQAHHTVEATSLNLLRADVPPELAEIVGKMMAKNPAQRYQTPVEVARALVPFFAGGQSGQPLQTPARGGAAPNHAAWPAGAAPRPIPVGSQGTPARSGTLLEPTNLVGPARSGTLLEPSALVGAARNATMMESPGMYSTPPASAIEPARSGRRQFGVAIAVGLFAAATITAAAIVLNRDPSPVAAKSDTAEKRQLGEQERGPAENESNQAAAQELARPQADGNPSHLGASAANSAAKAAAEPAAPPAFPAAAPFPAPSAPPPGAQPPSAQPPIFQPPPQPAPAAPVNQPPAAQPQPAPPPGSASALSARPSWQQDILLPNGKTLGVSHVLLAADRMQVFKSGMGANPFEMSYPEDDASSSSGASQKGKLNGPTLVRYANGSPMITAVYKDSHREGPVRMWDENGDFALYAEYKADYKDARLDGMACVFRDGLPWVLLQYSRGKLGAQYAVDFSASSPRAVPLDPSAEAAPGQTSLGEALSRMASLEAQLAKREMTLKRGLVDSFKDADQAKRKADTAKHSAQVHKEGMARRNAQDRAKAAQTEAAIQAGQRAVGGGAGF